MANAKQIGPIQLIVVGFENPKFQGTILDELNNLSTHKQIRIIDAFAVARDEDDNIIALQVNDLPKSLSKEYGQLIAGLIGLGVMSDSDIDDDTALGDAMLVDKEYEYGMSQDELESIAEDIPKGGVAAMLLVEHRWLLPLKNAVREANGVLIAQDFLSPESLVEIGKDLLQVAETDEKSAS